jgi:hypothetical protein
VLKAKIPFEFSVGDRILPAGEYRVEQLSPSTMFVVLLRRADDGPSAAALTLGIQANGSQNESKLVFHRYGDHYFLSQIWTEGANVGRQLAPSRRETEMARKEVKEEIALLVR